MRGKQTLINVAFFTFLSLKSLAQTDTIPLQDISFSADSIVLAVWQIQTKEMSSSEDDATEFSIQLQREFLDLPDSKKLNTLLTQSASFDFTRALLYHYNLVFEFWQNGSVVTEVYVSTLTGNIDIVDVQTETAFENNCGSNLNSFLLELLHKHSLIDLVGDVGTDGLEP